MDLRNQLFSKYRDVKFIFIDEISMVGSLMFNKADIGLRQLFDCNKFFGGLNVIAIGDFYQMHPVQDCYVFKNPGFSYECLAPNP